LPTLSTLHIYFSYNDTATTEIYTLSLHDALPISEATAATAAAAEVTPSQSYREDDDFSSGNLCGNAPLPDTNPVSNRSVQCPWRSEEHTSELQSRGHLVCRLLLEKKKKKNNIKQL